MCYTTQTDPLHVHGVQTYHQAVLQLPLCLAGTLCLALVFLQREGKMSRPYVLIAFVKQDIAFVTVHFFGRHNAFGPVPA